MAANTIFTTKTIFASLVAIGIAGAAQAQAPSTFDTAGQAPGQQVGNIEGGGATISGGGDNLTITYSTGGGGGVLSQSGRLARFASTHGDGLLVEYGPGRRPPTSAARRG